MAATLIDCVRQGCFSFELLVDVMEDPGFLLETDEYASSSVFGGEQTLSMVSSVMEVITQSDFDALYKALYPGREHSIKIACRATSEGAGEGCYNYALINLSRVSEDDVLAILKRENEIAWRHHLNQG